MNTKTNIFFLNNNFFLFLNYFPSLNFLLLLPEKVEGKNFNKEWILQKILQRSWSRHWVNFNFHGKCNFVVKYNDLSISKPANTMWGKWNSLTVKITAGLITMFIVLKKFCRFSGLTSIIAYIREKKLLRLHSLVQIFF